MYRSTSGNLFYNTQQRVKKRDGSYKRKLISLKTHSIEQGVKEVKKRDLYKKFNCSDKEKRLRMRKLSLALKDLKYLSNAKTKLQDNIELFQWPPYKKVPSAVINKDLDNLNYSSGAFEFNPRWVTRNSDLSIIRKIRALKSNERYII